MDENIIMKALVIQIEKFLGLLNKKLSDPNFKPKIYELVDLEEIPEPDLHGHGHNQRVGRRHCQSSG